VQLQACALAVAGRPDLRLRLDVQGALGYVQHMAGHYHAAMAAIAQAADCAERLGAQGDAVEQWLNLSLCARAVGDRPRALQAGEQALAAWRRQGEPAGGAVPSLHLQVGALKLAVGRFSTGLPLLEQALDHFRRHDMAVWRVIAEHRLANAWLQLGQPARASQTLSPLPADASPGGHAARAMVLARLARWAGQPSEPLLLAALQQHGERLEAMDARALALQLAGTGPADLCLARCDALLQTLGGHPATRVAASDDAADHAANQPTLVHALARRADALRRLGRHAEALADARLAWQAGAHATPLELGHPDFCRLVVQAAAAAGDAALQRQALQSALDWMDGARPCLLPAWQQGFFHRHPANRALLAMAAAQGMVPAGSGAPLPAPA
jgi:tetratricopeptide (TPR) repeat protein